MAYLITHLIWWLLAAAAFAALAGWAYHAMRTQKKDEAQLKERARLMQELVGAAPPAAGDLDATLDVERVRRRAELAEARAAELERALEAARARADDAASTIAELERRDERDAADTEEVIALRARLAALEEAQQRIVDVEPAQPDEAVQTQAWRLRYFEQRVRYLESLPPPEAPPPPEPVIVKETEQDLASQWRARYFEARTRYLEEAARAVAPPSAPEPVPADEPVEDTATQWRLRYLARRAAHFAAAASAEETAPAEQGADHEPEAARLKWRVRYLEARVRHLERRPAPLITLTETPPPAEAYDAEAREEEEETLPPPPRPTGAEQRPPALPAARGGAPDDFTLIEGVSPLQQSTLNSLGVFHFDQIAAWTPAHVAWVDQYLRLRGRIGEEEWVEQAQILAREGPAAARRMQLEDELA